MHVNINKMVIDFKEDNPSMKNSQIAELLFPDKTPDQASQTLSRLMNGHRRKVMTVDFIILSCKTFNISPNKFFNYE